MLPKIYYIKYNSAWHKASKTEKYPPAFCASPRDRQTFARVCASTAQCTTGVFLKTEVTWVQLWKKWRANRPIKAQRCWKLPQSGFWIIVFISYGRNSKRSVRFPTVGEMLYKVKLCEQLTIQLYSLEKRMSWAWLASVYSKVVSNFVLFPSDFLVNGRFDIGKELSNKLSCIRFIVGLLEHREDDVSSSQDSTSDEEDSCDQNKELLKPDCLKFFDKIAGIYPFSDVEKLHMRNTLKLQVKVCVIRSLPNIKLWNIAQGHSIYIHTPPPPYPL